MSWCLLFIYFFYPNWIGPVFRDIFKDIFVLTFSSFLTLTYVRTHTHLCIITNVSQDVSWYLYWSLITLQAEKHNPGPPYLLFPLRSLSLYRFTMNLIKKKHECAKCNWIFQSLWIFTTDYKGMKNYSFCNNSKFADLSKTIKVEGNLLDTTEMDPHGGDI